MTTPARDEALRDRVAREVYRRLYPGSINMHDSERTAETDAFELDRAYRTWDEGRAGYAPERKCREIADALLGVLADSRAEAWDEAHRVSCDMANNCWGGGCPLHENPYREEARDG